MGRSTSTSSARRRGAPLALLAIPLAVAVAGSIACGTAEPPADPPPPFQDLIQAQGLLRLGDPEGALALAETRLDGETALWAHRVVQDSLLALGRDREVRERYLALSEANPDSAEFAYLAGRILLPDAEEARARFERAVDLDPGLAWGHIGLARLEVLRGDMFQAIVMHREQLDPRPRDPDLQMSLGFLCLDLQLLRDAQRAFAVALDLRPWDPRIQGGMGQTLGLLDREEESLVYLRRALELDPSRTDLMAAEAYVLFRAGHHEEAWDVVVRQSEVDGSADPLICARLEAKLGRPLPQVVPLGPMHLRQPEPGP